MPSITRSRAGLPRDEMERLSGLRLVSGMPAEVFVQAGSRTMMSYLLKPISDQLGRHVSASAESYFDIGDCWHQIPRQSAVIDRWGVRKHIGEISDLTGHTA